MLRVENLTKRFGGVVALSRVTLDLDGISLWGLIGPNALEKLLGARWIAI
jgi:ABC-type branched-subunit amino acid transport system ATPase component